MNSNRRYIMPKQEPKDKSLFVALGLSLVFLLILLFNAQSSKTTNDSFQFNPEPSNSEQANRLIATVNLQVSKLNRRIKYQQALLQKLINNLEKESFHRGADQKKLRRLLKEYGIDGKLSDPTEQQNIQQLELRLQTVPNAIVIAMAIYESNWGRSGLALRNNNYFVNTCKNARCKNSDQAQVDSTKNGVSHSVDKFKSFQDSVKAVVNTFNSHPDFQVFRNTRAGFQRRGQLYRAEQLITTLKYAGHYNESQIQQLIEIIKTNRL